MSCNYCDGTGHLDTCDAREPAYDIADLICMGPCTGCCPNKCEEDDTMKRKRSVRDKALDLLSSPVDDLEF